MVEIWFVKDGPEAPKGESPYDLPLKTCVDQVGLAKSQWLQGLEPPTPRFGDQSQKGLSLFRDARHMVCKVSEDEASEHSWKPGYYRLALEPKEVIVRLGEPRKPREIAS